MEVIDHISARVSLAAAFGAVAGVARALHKGHASTPRTAALTALSCALTATPCFGAERLVACAATPLVLEQGHNKHQLQPATSSWEFYLTTHAMGGFIGGSLVGLLYIGRPLRGAVFFVPIMLVIGAGEKLLEDVRQEHRELILQEQLQQQHIQENNADDNND